MHDESVEKAGEERHREIEEGVGGDEGGGAVGRARLVLVEVERNLLWEDGYAVEEADEGKGCRVFYGDTDSILGSRRPSSQACLDVRSVRSVEIDRMRSSRV